MPKIESPAETVTQLRTRHNCETVKIKSENVNRKPNKGSKAETKTTDCLSWVSGVCTHTRTRTRTQTRLQLETENWSSMPLLTPKLTNPKTHSVNRNTTIPNQKIEA